MSRLNGLSGFWRGGRFAALLGAGAMGIACSQNQHDIPDAAPPQPRVLYQPGPGATALPEQSLDRPPYRLGVGDTVEIIYQVRNQITERDYELKIEDGISIAFPYQPQFNQELTVGGDGNVHCLIVGKVRAAGMTAEALTEYLKEEYGKHLKDPELTVVVDAANVKIEELKRAITTAPRGQSRLVPIKPDGTIDLPYVGKCHVAGLTVEEAKHLLDERYAAADLQEVEVTVQTLEFALKRVYVHGEVRGNGMLTMESPTTLMQALAAMGGVNERAEKSKILLVRRKDVPVPEAIVFDMEQFLEPRQPGPQGREADGGIYRYDPYLADGDIIYVPSTLLAQANDWIDQVFTRGIRAVMPYSGYVGMNFGYQIRNAPSTVNTREQGPPRISTNFGP